MPQFDCGNATLAYPSCSYLIKYCNSHYITNYNWCDCMIDPPQSEIYNCDKNALGKLLGIIFFFFW
jgi:hypothetical protein